MSLNSQSKAMDPLPWKYTKQGCLGGSVSWASNSWFQLRPWSWGCGMELCVRVCHAERGACLGFPFSLPLPISRTCQRAYSLSLSQNKSINLIKIFLKLKFPVALTLCSVILHFVWNSHQFLHSSDSRHPRQMGTSYLGFQDVECILAIMMGAGHMCLTQM